MEEEVMRKIKERTFSGTTNPEVTERELKHMEVARRAAAEGMVLLKNEGHILPIAPGARIALYGSGASKTVKGGTGSGDVNERKSVSIYEGLKAAGYRIVNEDWIADYDSRYEKARMDWRDDILARTAGLEATTDFFAVYTTTPFVRPDGKDADKTEADYALFILSRVAGEGADRFAKEGDYFLTQSEEKMLGDLCGFYENVIVVINTGGLMDLSFMDKYENIRALLQIVQPGMEGGNAFADIISGKVTPSGKMTDSWAYRYEGYPNAENFSHNNGDVDKEKYNEGIYVGYRYFDTFDIPVRYGFGYGLSYTDFELRTEAIEIAENTAAEALQSMGKSGASLGKTAADMGKTSADAGKTSLRVRVTVKNSGDAYSGKEVVQAYVTCPAGKLEKEYRRLAAFAKTSELAPGESQELTLEIPLEQLASYDESEPGWVLEPGTYGIWIGNSLESAELIGEALLDNRAVLVKTENICPLQEELEEFHADMEARQKRYETAAAKAIDTLKRVSISAASLKTETPVYAKNADICTPEAKAFVDSLTTEELVCLAAGDPGKAQGGNLGAAGISVPGSAGETHKCAMDRGLASIVLADGPAGLRLMQYYHVDNGKIVTMPFQFSLEGGIFCPDTDSLPGQRYYQYCTAIPVGTLLAQTWDTALIREVGAMIGSEMDELGVTLWLAPGMNIHRNPLCGRNFEYYSEDPLLSGKIAAAMTDGVQSVPGCGTTIKHFACNNQEDNRKGSDSILSERALREIYLKGFETAVKESQPMSIMTSYNFINGIHAANSCDLCTKAARDEWGFKGVIMTDWTTTREDPTCTASGCMRAGNDLIMPGSQEDYDNLYKELEEGSLPVEDLKACICRLVDVIWRSNRYLVH